MAWKDTIEQAFREIAIGLLTLTDYQIIPADDDGTRPPKPYLTIDAVTIDIPQGLDEIMGDESAGGLPSTYQRGQRAALVSVGAFGDDAGDWLVDLCAMLRQPSAIALMDTHKLTVMPVGGIRSITIPVGDRMERRMVQDFDCLYSITSDEETAVGPLQTVGIHVEDEAGTYSQDITVTMP